jgi:hypothetical protein
MSVDQLAKSDYEQLVSFAYDFTHPNLMLVDLHSVLSGALEVSFSVMQELKDRGDISDILKKQAAFCVAQYGIDIRKDLYKEQIAQFFSGESILSAQSFDTYTTLSSIKTFSTAGVLNG